MNIYSEDPANTPALPDKLGAILEGLNAEVIEANAVDPIEMIDQLRLHFKEPELEIQWPLPDWSIVKEKNILHKNHC